MSTALVEDLERQVQHWLGSARGCLDAESFASRQAWESVEHAVGIPVRSQLARTVDDLIRTGRSAESAVRAARTRPDGIPVAQAAVEGFRRRYLQVETTLDFFGQAVNSRTSARLRSTMATLDRLAQQSIEASLLPAGIVVPPVLTYIGEGLGASIIRVGIRLWAPGTVNPVAAIKIVRHNLFRPTSPVPRDRPPGGPPHGLDASLARGPRTRARRRSGAARDVAAVGIEIAADVYAFVLHRLRLGCSALRRRGDARTILRWPMGDPHPIGLAAQRSLGVAMCRAAFGPGPWDRLEEAV